MTRYASATRRVQHWFDALPENERQRYQAFAFPVMGQFLYEQLCQWKEVLLAASAHCALQARAPLVGALCLSSDRKALAGDTGAARPFAAGSEPLVVGLSTSLESTCQASAFRELTFVHFCRTADCSLLWTFSGRVGVSWLSPLVQYQYYERKQVASVTHAEAAGGVSNACLGRQGEGGLWGSPRFCSGLGQRR